jgi:drug/metabolite transporter (DMT)-like permease
MITFVTWSITTEVTVMQNALVYALLAMIFYASEIVVTDLKLGRLSPRLVTLLYATGVALLAGLSLILFPDKSLEWPTRKEWWFVALMVVVSFIAATMHFFALHEKAGATTMCTYYCLLPVTAALLVYLFSGEHKVPSWRTIAAWVLGAVAVYLISTEKK